MFYHGSLSDDVESQTTAMQEVLKGQAARAQSIVDFKMSSGTDFAYYPNISSALKQQLTEAISEVQTVESNEQRLALIDKFTTLFNAVYDCRKAYVELGKAAEELLGFSSVLNGIGLMDNDELLAKQAETDQYWDTYKEGNLSADEAREMALKIADSTGKPALVDGYYEVQNPIQWVWFVNHVEQENKVNCALVDDLDLSEYPNLPRLSNFRGTMDGRDHKITIKLTATDKEFAFINSAYNATFCNLRLDGSLDAGTYRSPAGMINYCEYTTFRRIYSTVDITSNYSGDVHAAGILQQNGGEQGTKFIDCCYAGKMEMPNGYLVGGMAHSSPIIEFENCLVAADINCTHVNSATI